jgi:uncharacterized membrane protein YhaH (DUF805 family)
MMIAINRWRSRQKSGLMDLIERGLSYAPTIEGRATRTELFMTLAAISLGVTVLWQLADRLTGTPGALLQTALIILMLLPYGSAVIRRMHDTGRSAVDLWICVIPWVGPAVATGYLLWAGNIGPNAYGPDPRKRA